MLLHDIVGSINGMMNNIGMLFVSGVFKHASLKTLRSSLGGTFASVSVEPPQTPVFIFDSKAYDNE
jgi:hypothetical protein